jgi:hypothetical protein
VARHADGGTGYGDDATLTTPAGVTAVAPPAPPGDGYCPVDNPNCDEVTTQAKAKVPMKVKLLTTKATVVKGVLALKLRCTGDAVPRCRAAVAVDWNGIPAGSAKVAIKPGTTYLLRIRLTKKIKQVLARKKRIGLTVVVTYFDGMGKTIHLSPYVKATAAPTPKKPAPKKR